MVSLSELNGTQKTLDDVGKKNRNDKGEKSNGEDPRIIEIDKEMKKIKNILNDLKDKEVNLDMEHREYGAQYQMSINKLDSETTKLEYDLLLQKITWLENQMMLHSNDISRLALCQQHYKSRKHMLDHYKRRIKDNVYPIMYLIE